MAVACPSWPGRSLVIYQPTKKAIGMEAKMVNVPQGLPLSALTVRWRDSAVVQPQHPVGNKSAVEPARQIVDADGGDQEGDGIEPLMGELADGPGEKRACGGDGEERGLAFDGIHTGRSPWM